MKYMWPQSKEMQIGVRFIGDEVTVGVYVIGSNLNMGEAAFSHYSVQRWNQF